MPVYIFLKIVRCHFCPRNGATTCQISSGATSWHQVSVYMYTNSDSLLHSGGPWGEIIGAGVVQWGKKIGSRPRSVRNFWILEVLNAILKASDDRKYIVKCIFLLYLYLSRLCTELYRLRENFGAIWASQWLRISTR